jgi:hypothetical protein
MGNTTARTTATARPTGRGMPPRAVAARHVTQQRRVYAHAVLRALARSHRGRPTPQIQRLLSDTLTPLGLRLPTATLQRLATDIAAGHTVELP